MSFNFHNLVVVPFAGALLLCASCSQEPELQLPADTLAVIGERIITQRDLDAEMMRRVEAGLASLSPADLLDRMLTRESMLVKAHSQSLQNDPDVNRELERVLVSRLRELELTERYDAISVSEDELKQEYADGIDQFTRPALNRISMLYLKKEKGASAEKIEGLRARMQEAKNAASQLAQPATGFGELSVSFSDDVVSRYRGGDLGWISGTQAPLHIPEQVFLQTLELPIGQPGELIEIEQGFYLTMRTDERPATVKTFEQVRAGLKNQLLSKKRSAAEQSYYQECLLAANVQLNEQNVDRLEVKNEQLASQDERLPALHGEF